MKPATPTSGKAIALIIRLLLLLSITIPVVLLATTEYLGNSAVFARFVVSPPDSTITPAAGPLTLSVNALGDAADTNVGDGRCDTDAATPGEQCTLRAAIQETNAAATGTDLINFSLPANSAITLNTALPNITGNLTVNGPGANTLTVARSTTPGTPNFRIFIIPGGSTATISGLTVSNGSGGFANGGTLILKDMIVSGNSTVNAAPGGGIFSTGVLTLINSAVTGNNTASGGEGGGIALMGIINTTPGLVQLNNSVVTNNTVGNGSGGGGISTTTGAGTLTLMNAMVSGNTGTGIANGGTTVNLVNSTVSSNSSRGIDNTAGDLTMTGSTVSGNTEGGIFNSGGATLTNSTISSNSTPYFGGGIYNYGLITLTNCTVSNNMAGNFGGGIYGDPLSRTSPTTNLNNTIVANNTTPSGSGQDLSGSGFVSQDYNLIRDMSGASFTGTTTHNITGQDPKLGPLADNGGPTKTHTLLIGSPAIDAGNSSVTTDQRGQSRPIEDPDAANAAGGNASDIGAFEEQVSLEDITDKTTNEDTQLQFSFNAGSAAAITGVTATSSNTSLTPNNAANISVSGSGSTRILTINPTLNQSGASTITVTTTRNNGPNMTDTFLLTVNSVNDAPSFTKGPDQTVNNDAGLQMVNNWAGNISPGPPDEAGQAVSFLVTGNSNPALFAVAPAISSTGTLSYQPATNAGGTATITLVVQDSGGTANGGQNTSAAQAFTINVNPSGGYLQFNSGTFTTTESSGFTTITVKRTGELSRAVTVDYATADGTASLIPCSTANALASSRCDFTSALGTLRFAAGEDTKTFIVLINQDSYVEGPETLSIVLSNQTGGSALTLPSTATLRISDDATEPGGNPVDDARGFVVQHYHDFLNREPDQPGLDFWVGNFTPCGTDVQCINARRINVSAAFFLSIEFQQTGYLVERLYKTAYGAAIGNSTFPSAHTLPVPIVRFNEFLADTQQIGLGVVVGQAGWEQALENNKQAFAAGFVQRVRFTNIFGSLSNAQFVDQLNTNAGNPLSLSERDQLVGEVNNSGKTRAQVLRAVAEQPNLVTSEFNRAFVLMQFFGYLRRNPNDPQDADYTGYDFWLTKLNNFTVAGDDPLVRAQKADMVKSFITSTEYRQRFGP